LNLTEKAGESPLFLGVKNLILGSGFFIDERSEIATMLARA
jgi:hypothetical protein